MDQRVVATRQTQRRGGGDGATETSGTPWAVVSNASTVRRALLPYNIVSQNKITRECDLGHVDFNEIEKVDDTIRMLGEAIPIEDSTYCARTSREYSVR